ncbi:hypothetical protein DFH06DRAFT_1316507 [Mycena polygramma]|nr:hypothetical protein DFH06DRAFT_1316507 [Mycena polygramma]
MLPQALHLENAVSQLPLRLRLLARAAAAGSSKDLQRLRDLAKAVPASSQVVLFLLVFYANLDPRLIPSSEQVDTLPWNDFILPISNAVCSLDYLRILKPIPVDARLSIWHRVWAWMQFIHIYRTCIHRLETYSEPAVYGAFLTVAHRLDRDKGIGQELGQVPGFSVVLVHAWKVSILAPDDASSSDALREVCTLLCSYSTSTGALPHHLEEFIEGAGGSVSHLASLAVKHLDHHVTHPHTRFPLFILSSVVMFLATNLEGKPAFQDALVSHGSMACFVRVALVLAEGRHGPGDDIMIAGDGFLHKMLSHTWSYLIIHLLETHAYGRVREAVRAGLLQAIVASAIGCDTTSNTPESLQAVLRLLKQYTVYYSVVSCLEPALRDVEALQTAHGFTHSFLFDNWSAFWGLAHERIEMLKYYDSADYVSLKACSALEASRVAPLSSFDTDKLIWYCSKRCQSDDWKDGHREACDRMVSLRQTEPEPLSTRDRSFLRALIDHDYKLTQPTILLWELDFMNAYPGRIPCVLFDYSQGRSKFNVIPAIDFPDKWSDDVARATRHRGRFQLHFAILPVADIDTTRLFPMQSSSGALVESLERLKEELDEGLGSSAPMHEQIQGRIAAAMSMAAHVTQIH